MKWSPLQSNPVILIKLDFPCRMSFLAGPIQQDEAMTVNWERESGERVEEFVAAFLLMRSGRGNQIRPSRGDQGIDVQIPTSDGWDIYQVKRFSRNLGSSEKRQITESWTRFRDEVFNERAIHSWSLVVPIEPTRENLLWLEELTSDAGIEVNWIGRATLDAWASESPRLVDYFFGDGGRRLHELMSLAFSGAQPVPSEAGEPLLVSIQDRMRLLNEALDEVDPFYRYEIEVRAGNFDEIPTFEALQAEERPGLVESVMQAIDDHQYLVTHIIARSPVSTQLRPIQGRYAFAAETASEREALERFHLYGAPLAGAVGTVEMSEGPPGTTLAAGARTTAWTIMPLADGRLPPLELRLIRDDQVQAVLPVTEATASSGVTGGGLWLRVQLGPAAMMEYFVGADGRDDVVTITADRAIGAEPGAVLPTVEFMAQLPGSVVELNVRDGPPFLPSRTFHENQISSAAVEYARFVRALSVVQRFTVQRVVIPDISDPTSAEVVALLRHSALLDGVTVTGSFSQFPVGDTEFFDDWDETERALVVEQPITVTLSGFTWETMMNERQEFESVRLDRSTDPPTVVPAASNRVRAFAVPRRDS